MFCEKENLQLLCKSCHDIKSFGERAASAEARRKRKENNE
ncbi:MAG: HNH endonuclease [Bacteroidetes bacterium]|nr:HNH endonuclease [Bacteroidota bacterium]